MNTIYNMLRTKEKKYKEYEIKRGKTKKRKDYLKNYYQNHKDYFKNYMKKVHEKERLKVFRHYGKKCELCSQRKEEVLTIDHINGGGVNHRKKVGGNIYYWLIKNKFPKGFRTLCYNCNCSMVKLNKGRFKNIKNDLYHKMARERNSNYRKKYHALVFNNYGWKCAKCGQKNKNFLTIDHINCNGTNHIQSKEVWGHFYIWLVKNNFPKDFQTLCYNCNCSKERIKPKDI